VRLFLLASPSASDRLPWKCCSKPQRRRIARGRSGPSTLPWLGLVIYPLLLSMPATTAYAVAFDRVLDVRLALRRTAQYAVARYTLLPRCCCGGGAGGDRLSRREEPISHLLSGGTPAALATLAAAAVVAWRLRPRILVGIDVVFAQVSADGRECRVGAGQASQVRVDADRTRRNDAPGDRPGDPGVARGAAGVAPRRGTLEPFGFTDPAAVARLGDRRDAGSRPGAAPLSAHFLAVFGGQLRGGSGWFGAADAELLVRWRNPTSGCAHHRAGRKRSDADFSAADVRTMAAIAGAASLALQSLLERQR